MIWVFFLGTVLGAFAFWVLQDIWLTVFVRTRPGGDVDLTHLSREKR